MKPGTVAFVEWVDKNIFIDLKDPHLDWIKKVYLKEMFAKDVYLEIAKTIVKDLS